MRFRFKHLKGADLRKEYVSKPFKGCDVESLQQRVEVDMHDLIPNQVQHEVCGGLKKYSQGQDVDILHIQTWDAVVIIVTRSTFAYKMIQ